jgi:hypothetical protein
MEGLNADQRSGFVGSKPSYTIGQAAVQLDRTNLNWAPGLGQPTTITYAYRADAPATMPADTAGFSEFNTNQIDATEQALAAWSAVAGITFIRVGSGDSGPGAYSDNATILFGDYASGQAGASAFTILPGSRASSSGAGDVWVNSSLPENASLGLGSYGSLALLHEIGHAIGLSHPSDYDASDQATPITYANDASYYEDSLQYSVMSYFPASDTGSDIENTVNAPMTPLIDDIAAAQRLYGVNPQGNAGNTTYNLAWSAIWDSGGIDTLRYDFTSFDEKIDLRAGNFSDVLGAHGNLAIALGTTIEDAIAGGGNDIIIGNNAGNLMEGNAGNDVMTGGIGNDTYIGGDGTDRAMLGGNVSDYRLVDGGSSGLILESLNGSGNIWIDSSTETIQFQNGQYLSLGDVHAYVPTDNLGGEQAVVASALGAVTVAGTAAPERLFVDGDPSDYTLSRVVTAGSAPVGDFVLTNVIDGNVITIGEAVDQIGFNTGQYLSLHDLGAYVSGSNALSFGDSQNDLLSQTKLAGFEMFVGGAGNDTVYLNGNVGDFTLTTFNGGLVPDQSTRSGWALVGRNGSGIEFIDSSVETVQFQNGQYLSYKDIPAYIQAAGAPMSGVRVVADGTTPAYEVSSLTSADTLFLDGSASDYSVGRGNDGSFNFKSATTNVMMAETLSAVHFQSGQILSVADIPAYMHYQSFTTGTNASDQLWAGASGDQYIFGGGGNDNAYLQGNVGDYSIQSVSNLQFGDPYAGASYDPNAVHILNGYELVAKNGSGNIYIDNSTETIHFQNNQYLSFNDLTAYIHHV